METRNSVPGTLGRLKPDTAFIGKKNHMEKVEYSVIQNILLELSVQYSLLGFNTDASKAKD
jgi:hypothetical protein